jgi:hypothetical protein
MWGETLEQPLSCRLGAGSAHVLPACPADQVQQHAPRTEDAALLQQSTAPQPCGEHTRKLGKAVAGRHARGLVLDDLQLSDAAQPRKHLLQRGLADKGVQIAQVERAVAVGACRAAGREAGRGGAHGQQAAAAAAARRQHRVGGVAWGDDGAGQATRACWVKAARLWSGSSERQRGMGREQACTSVPVYPAKPRGAQLAVQPGSGELTL